MSEPRRSGTSTGLGIGLGIAAGCGLGCLGLVTIVGAFAWWSVHAVRQQVEAMQAQSERIAAVEREIDALEEAHPPRLGGSLADVALSEADVAAYGAVRERVDPALIRIAENRARMEKLADGFETGRPPDIGQLLSVVREAQGAAGHEMETRAALAAAVRDGLAEAGLGPTDFARLLEIVEWRFLRRPEAALLALPADRRWDLRSQRERVGKLRELAADPAADATTLRPWLRDAGPAGASTDDLRQRLGEELAEAEGRLAEIEAETLAGPELSGACLAVLESSRASLEARAMPDLLPLLTTLGGDAPEWSGDVERSD